MLIQLLAIGDRAPEWVTEGFNSYAKRLRGKIKLQLVELPAPRRGHNADITRLVYQEGQRLMAKAAPGVHVIALDLGGRTMTTENLAVRLTRWCQDGSNVTFLVGGADGLSREVLSEANEIWSLSKLTMAHFVVRVVIAEQLYRAYSLMEGLPYHRTRRPD
jgi:23S rRNA (pseudouridine1915-N3)-methyltransferase